MNDKTQAIMEILLGASVKSVADRFKGRGFTYDQLRSWSKNYSPPSSDVISHLIKERVVELLLSDCKGGELTGIVGALKHIGEGQDESIIDSLMALGAEDDIEAADSDVEDDTIVSVQMPIEEPSDV